MPMDARSLLRQSDRVYRGGSFVRTGPNRGRVGVRPPHGDPRYTFPMSSRKIDSNSTPTTVTNTTSATTVFSVNAPALTIRSEGATRMSASGTVLNTAAAAGAVTFRVSANDGSGEVVVLDTPAIACSTSVSERKWVVETIMFGDATNSQKHWGTLDMSEAAAETMPAASFQSVGYSVSSLDETQTITVTVSAQLSAASTGFTVVGQSAIFEAVV